MSAELVVIGVSAGGLNALGVILGGLPADFPLPIVVVQHLAPGFAGHLVSWLSSASRLRVRIATDGEPARAGTVYVAPDGAHLLVEAAGQLRVDARTPPVDGHRPSGTRLLSSVARVWASRSVGVVLTGMGADGVAGLADVHAAGGLTIAQDQATSVVYGMPRAAAERGAAREILPVHDIADRLCRAAEQLQARPGRDQAPG